MPPIGLALGKVDFANLLVVLKQGTLPIGPYHTLADAQAAHAVTINYGTFINTVITFIIIAAVVFFLIVRPIAQMSARQKAKETVVPAALPRQKSVLSARHKYQSKLPDVRIVLQN